MTAIRDLDECRYLVHFGQRDERLIAVGWLGKDAPYTKGEVDRTFLAKLEKLCKRPWEPHHAMGWHCCEFCPDPFLESSSKRLSWFRAPSPVPALPYQLSVANLFIPYQRKVFAAPEGIVHYISSHGYRPPDIFVEAVLACPPMGSDEYMDALREHGGPSIVDALGRTWTDCAEVLRYLAEHYAFDRENPFTPVSIGLDATTPEGNSPLHVVVGWDNRIAVRLLVDSGANVNAVGAKGETPLHVAAKRADALVIGRLLRAGASMTAVSELGETPADLLKERRDLNASEWREVPPNHAPQRTRRSVLRDFFRKQVGRFLGS